MQAKRQYIGDYSEEQPRPFSLSRSVRKRILLKKTKGQQLTPVELHLVHPSSGLHRALCGPSLHQTILAAFKHCSKPLAVVLLATIVVRQQLHENAQTFEEEYVEVNPEFREIVASIANLQRVALLQEAEASVSSSLDNDGLPAPIVFTPPTTPTLVTNPEMYEEASLIKFISGVIAVFCPSTESAGEIARHIVEVSNENGLDPLYVASVISMESGFRTRAKSSVGALGLMQLLPTTAEEVFSKLSGKDKTPIRQFLQNPEINIRLGIEYLKSLETRYKGDRSLALAAYNWGPGNVAKARKAGRPIPASVRKYSSGILERTQRWQKHFSKARESAAKVRVEQTIARSPESLSTT